MKEKHKENYNHPLDIYDRGALENEYFRRLQERKETKPESGKGNAK